MVNSTVANELLTLVHEGFCESLSVLDDLYGIFFELWSANFLELDCKSSNGNIMWTTLQHGENGKVDLLGVLDFVEDDSGSWSSQTLVGSRGDDIAVIEWGLHKSGGNESTDVSNISHKIASNAVSDCS